MSDNITNNDEPRKPAHTPGPWNFRLEAVRTVIFHSAEIGEKAIAVGAGSYPSHIANARLISASPDLLEALSRMIEPYNGWSDEELARRVDVPTFDRITRAQAAIAKALGQ